MNEECVAISHGSGTGLSYLLDNVILPELRDVLISGPFEDAACLDLSSGRIAFTTDSFVVSPRKFPGGNIGKLAACGTLNDLAMMGAKPLFLSFALILEEGLPFSELREYLQSFVVICKGVGVKVACGDTKVVERGKADGLFINTSGIGLLSQDYKISVVNAQISDCVIVSGPIGSHGITIMAERGNLNFGTKAKSDCASLYDAVKVLLDAVPETRCLRDATRGGVAAILNEIAQSSGVTILLNEESIPVLPEVKTACEFLGIDPLQSANEGTFVAIVPESKINDALKALHSVKESSQACVIGQVKLKERFPCILTTSIGGHRAVEIPHGRLLPRIC